LGKLISQCCADEAFKQRFIAEPAAVMKEAGLEVPEGVEFIVVENTDKVNYILLPVMPGELSDKLLNAVVGGHNDPSSTETSEGGWKWK
jgi:hypothetical protein